LKITHWRGRDSTLSNRSVTEIPQVENHALAWAG